MHDSILVYGRRRYLILCGAIVALAMVIYWFHDPEGPPNGGTWLGYAYGGLGAALILYLLYFGIRKRSYSSRLGTVQGWLSAHVYLGLALVVIVTLHTGLQFGMNVHTLAYVLMMAVVASGVYGVFAYRKYPSILSDSGDGVGREALLSQVNELDRRARMVASNLPNEYAELVGSAISRTVLGGAAWAMLRGRDLSRVVLPRGGGHSVVSNADQDAVLDWLAEQQSMSTDADRAAAIAELSTLFRNKRRLLQGLRRNIKTQAMLEVWLFLHVPLSFALLAALLVHVLTVFIYW